MANPPNPNCSVLQQKVIEAQEKANAAASEFATTKNKLEAALKAAKLRWDLTDEEKQIADLRTAADNASKALNAAQQELAKALENFKNTGLTPCPPPKGCSGGPQISAKIFEIVVPPQTQDTTELMQEKTRLQQAIAKLEAEIDALEDCIKGDRVDFSSFQYNPLNKILSYAGGTSTIEQFRSNISSNNCLDNTEQSIVLTIAAPKNDSDLKKYWNTGKNPWVLKEKAIEELNSLYDRAKEIAKRRLLEKQKELNDLKSELDAIDAKISEYSNSDSDYNIRMRKAIEEEMNRRLAECSNKIKFETTTTVTAGVGPGAPEPPPGQTGVSKVFRQHRCITFKNGQFSLDLNSAVADLGPGGCGVANAYWIHPVNVTSNITVSNLNDIITCITGRGLPGNPAATIINQNANPTLSGCKGPPKKK